MAQSADTRFPGEEVLVEQTGYWMVTPTDVRRGDIVLTDKRFLFFQAHGVERQLRRVPTGTGQILPRIPTVELVLSKVARWRPTERPLDLVIEMSDGTTCTFTGIEYMNWDVMLTAHFNLTSLEKGSAGETISATLTLARRTPREGAAKTAGTTAKTPVMGNRVAATGKTPAGGTKAVGAKTPAAGVATVDLSSTR